MTIREYAEKMNHTVVGKLTRRTECEWQMDEFGNMEHEDFKFYADEGGNEYYQDKKGVCIVTADGNVL